MIQLDPEEVFGGAFFDAFKRVVLCFLLIWGGSFVGIFSIFFAEMIVSAVQLDFSTDIKKYTTLILLGPLSGFVSSYLFLYAIVFFTSVFLLAKVSEPSKWLYLGILCAFAILAVSSLSNHFFVEIDEPLWLVFITLTLSLGSLYLLFRNVIAIRQRGVGDHFQQIAIENELKRKQLKEKFGTAAFDKVREESDANV